MAQTECIVEARTKEDRVDHHPGDITLHGHDARSSKSTFDILKSAVYFLKTLWLFTESDFATFVLPDAAFGIFGALTGSLLTTNQDVSALAILRRLPLVILYDWSNLLIFDLANQRLPESIMEDKINKAHRPLPTGRMTALGTRRLLLISLPCVLAINYALGAWRETALLFMLTWMYNDLGGGDEDFILRNTIIAFAFGLYNEGSLRVAAGPLHEPNAAGYFWTAIISGVIFTTMHAQDMKDQEGDKARGRRSAPLVLGDTLSRWSIALPVLVWSVICPRVWSLGPLSYVVPVGLGSLVASRLFLIRTFEGDRRTWKLWAFWTACLYFLPLTK